MLYLSDLKVEIGLKTLLDVENFSIEAGELFAILGRNGAGKSTLFKSISGDIKSTGQRYFHHRLLEDWPKRFLARHLAVLPQTSQLNFPFTVREVVNLGLIPLSTNRQQGYLLVTQQLEVTDTIQFSDRPYLSLSGGERQRVHFARVLVQLSQAEYAPLLLLDEPTSAQDLAQQHQLLQMTKNLCDIKGFGALIIIHDLNLSLRYAHRVGLLKQGAFTDIGKPEQILTPDSVDKHWGYRPQKVTTNTGLCAFL